MSEAPRVFPKVTLVGTREGVDLYLLTVESWPGGHLLVRIAGIPTEQGLARLMAEDAETTARHLPDRDGNRAARPRRIRERIFEAIEVRVTDDAGTAYALTATSSGGMRSELWQEWTFAPELPGAATPVVSLRVGDGEALTF
jgi:hypothetical protein